MSAPLEPTKIVQSSAVTSAPRRAFDGSLVLALVGMFLIVSVFHAHEVSLLLRVPALSAGELLAAIGTVSYRRARPSAATTFSLEIPTGPGTSIGVWFLVVGVVLGALFLSVTAPAYMIMLGMAASLALVVVGWGSLSRG